MATEIQLTAGLVTLSADSDGMTGGVQDVADAIDVSAGDVCDLILTLEAVEGPVDTFVVTILTGMSRDSESGWYPLGSFASLTAAGSNDKARFVGLLKYIRWKVTNLTGGGAAAFQVRGMLRSG